LDFPAIPLNPLDRCSENVIVEAIIIPELELRNVKVKVLFADIVECAAVAAKAIGDERQRRLDWKRIEQSAAAFAARTNWAPDHG